MTTAKKNITSKDTLTLIEAEKFFIKLLKHDKRGGL